jgi:hypothetical protein
VLGTIGPMWSADGQHLFYTRLQSGAATVFQQPVAEAAAAVRVREDRQEPMLTSDVRAGMLLVRMITDRDGWNLEALPAEGRNAPTPVASGPYDERAGQFSPDGH